MNVKQKILIADDSEINRALLMEILGDGYEYLEAENGVRAVALLREHTDIALVLLDINLPDGSGLDFLREIKTSSPLRPVILLTANDTDMDIVNGLEQRADDYITKPFKLGVLLSRVHALLRRAGGFGAQQATELCSGGIRVDLLAGRAEKNGVPLELTAAEYKLLCLFLRSPGQVLTKETILNALWDCEGNYVDTNTLTVYIRRLRLKVEDDPGSPQRLVTVRGMGYRWNGDV